MKIYPWAKAFQSASDQEMEHGVRPDTDEEEELVPMVAGKEVSAPPPPGGPIPIPYPNFGLEHDADGQILFDEFGA